MDVVLWLLVVVPAVVGVGLCLFGRSLERAAAPLSVATATVVALLAGVAALGHPAVQMPFVVGTPFALAVDPLSGVVVVTVAMVTVLVLAFAAADVRRSRGRFHGLMLVFAASVVTTATATTLPTLLVAWELMGATSYALVGFAWRQPGKVGAGAVAFVTTRAADLGLYLAAGAALAGGAGLALADLPAADAQWRHVVAAGVLVAAVGKAAQLPFSFWLSRAMEGPSAVSALLHSAAMVAMGGYLLLRVHELLAVTGWAATAAAWVGAGTALLLGVVALAQRDLKQLLAASTSAQLGFVVLGAGVGAVAGGTAHFVAHAATKALLFLVAGAWLTALGTQQLTRLRGAGRRWPTVGVPAAVGALALGGVAPLSLWATKEQMLAAALEQSMSLYAVGLAATVLSTAYAAKVLLVVAQQPDGLAVTGTGSPEASPRAAWLTRFPIVVLATGAVVLGVLALPPIAGHLRDVLGEAGASVAGPWHLLGSAVLAVGVLLAALRLRLPQPRWARTWLGLEQAMLAVVLRPSMRLAAVLARFDDRIVDRAVDDGARLLSRGAHRVADADLLGIDGAVEGVARTVRRLGDLARMPQTGQLHQYYVQAVGVLAAGLVLLVLVR